MANPISLSALTLNPEEVRSVSEFIKAIVLNNPELRSIHRIMDGVKMKQQLVLVDGFKKTGRKASGDCSRVSSGATSTLVQKYANPEKIEDFFEICASEWSGLWKPLFDKVQNYRELYDIEGSDVGIMIADMVQDSIKDSLLRLAWFGDKNVAAATASAPGLVSSSDVAAYSPIDGIWTQVFAAAAASPSALGYRYSLSSIQGTSTVTATNAYNAFMGVYKGADAKLRANKDAKFYCTDQIALGLMEYMQINSVNFTLNVTENGWNTFKFLGHDVVVMPIFDQSIADFENSTADTTPYLQHRILFTLPNNLVLATLDEEGIENLEIFYEQKERKLAIGFGYTLDSIVLDTKLVSVAY